MKLVFVAPGVRPPLTEGRKLFVTELADLLRQRGFKVDVLTGVTRSSKLGMILQTLRELRQLCGKSHAPDAVFVFPYGTFAGVRRHVNSFLVRRTQSICKTTGVFMRPVFYSCAGLGFEQLSHRFKPALAVGRGGDGITPVHLGTLRDLPTWSPVTSGLKTALFLCGYQRATRAELNKVLYERGLVDILRAGDSLAEAGISLTVAVPFLRDTVMCKRLLRFTVQWCPKLHINMVGNGSPIALLATHDAFLFPYRRDHAVFVPTSLLEALQAGIPTLAADQESYRVLTRAGAVERCRTYRQGDPKDLADQLVRMQQNYASAVTEASTTAAYVKANWTMSRSVDELLAVIPALK